MAIVAGDHRSGGKNQGRTRVHPASRVAEGVAKPDTRVTPAPDGTLFPKNIFYILSKGLIPSSCSPWDRASRTERTTAIRSRERAALSSLITLLAR